VEFGGMRTHHHSYKRLVNNMDALGLRHRQDHDLAPEKKKASDAGAPESLEE
jgi:hypothetical protein